MLARGEEESIIEAADVPQSGDVLADRYEVERHLGSGGMGVIVAAHDRQLGRRVAIKLHRALSFSDADDFARFRREARALAALQSEHVARVLDVGTLADGTPFIVLEHLTGTDLERELARRVRLPVSETVDYLLQACEAIAEAHTAGIVHRDLKPANVFLAKRPDGSSIIKVLDFGIAKIDVPIQDQNNHNLTRTGAPVGSPRYMSPEQARNAKDVGPATDIWALGVVLHELVTGRAPFDGATLPAISVAIAADPAPALRDHFADAPAELECVVSRCMEKDPAQRFASIAELAEQLAPFATTEGRRSVARIAAIQGASRAHATSTGDPGTPLRNAETRTGPSSNESTSGGARRNSRSTIAIVGALAVAAAATTVTVLVMRGERQRDVERPAPSSEVIAADSAAAITPAIADPHSAPEATSTGAAEPERPAPTAHRARTGAARPARPPARSPTEDALDERR